MDALMQFLGVFLLLAPVGVVVAVLVIGDRRRRAAEAREGEAALPSDKT